ncbi:MAG: type II toxin-antitoxin system RelE/ParE family toxin [Bacteroidales bacterium]|nr:type II toxin-antitoxin system RelE/ParE family toxin [Bacteroidales bacterium]
MRHSIVWLPEAKQDAADIASYITSTFGNRAAERMIDSVDENVMLLSGKPFIGEIFISNSNYRVLHLKRSSIYYRVNNDVVIIGALIDNRRNPDTVAAILKERNNQ